MGVTSVLITPGGPARAHVEAPGRGALVLGHGAGGGVDAPDLLAAARAARALGMAVVRVEQPWRVAGRRVAEAPSRLDVAWTAVCEQLRADGTLTGPLVIGGRSSGARVACRTATALGAAAVLALAFPLQPPGRGPSRLPELLAPPVPRLVVQGDRDAFGVPEPCDGVAVHVVAGADHAFAVRRKDGRSPGEVDREVEDAVGDWLGRTLRAAGGQTLT